MSLCSVASFNCYAVINFNCIGGGSLCLVGKFEHERTGSGLSFPMFNGKLRLFYIFSWRISSLRNASLGGRRSFPIKLKLNILMRCDGRFKSISTGCIQCNRICYQRFRFLSLAIPYFRASLLFYRLGIQFSFNGIRQRTLIVFPAY